MNKKILTDYHLHSCFSSDCSSDLDKIIEAAINKGLNSICLTDHYDMDFPVEKYNMDFDLDIERYIDTLQKLQNKYSDNSRNQKNGSSFDLRIGVEQGLMRSTCEKLENYSTLHPELDFIICSSHLVNGEDPYYPETFRFPDGSPRNPMDVYRAYYEDILYIVRNFHDYNVYGHLGYK